MTDSRMSDEAQQSRTLRLTPTPLSVGVARRQLADFCQGHGLGDVADTAILLVSELVTNAITHGRGEVTLSMTGSPSALRVDVHDESAEPPRLRSPTRDQADGRGLLLVDALGTSWHSRRHPHDGKTVSFTLAHSAA